MSCRQGAGSCWAEGGRSLRAIVTHNPQGYLSRYREGLIVDEDPRSARFILPGSRQRGLLAGISQSLTGWVGVLPLLPFALSGLEAAGSRLPDLDSLQLQGLETPLHYRKVDVRGWGGEDAEPRFACCSRQQAPGEDTEALLPCSCAA